jgi:uncharacterized protein (DUF427 family)
VIPVYWGSRSGAPQTSTGRSCDSPPRSRTTADLPTRGQNLRQGQVAAWSTIGRPHAGLPRSEFIVHPLSGLRGAQSAVGELLQVDGHEPYPTDERNSHVPGTVEQFMTPGHTISIVPTAARVEVRLGGRLLASTDRAMKLDETGLPARYYLPPDDVQMDLLRPTTFHTNCPFKGEASYWSLDIDGETHDGIVWSYATPTAQAAEVRGMMSFYPGRTEVTVDGQSLRD